MKKAELFDVQGGSLIGLVNDVLLSGATDESESEPIQDGEKVIGELTPFESAIWIAYGQAVKKHNAMGLLWKKGAKNVDSLLVSSEECKALEKLFWSSLQVRLGVVAFKGGGIGVRQGNQIVVMPRRNPVIDPLSLMLSMGGLGLGLGLGMGEDEHEHDCATCKVYDVCDLPIKKART